MLPVVLAGLLALGAPPSPSVVYGASRTQFLYVVTTRYRDGMVTPDWWDSSLLPPGPYVLRVFGEDFSGNRVTRDLDVIVTGQSPSPSR